MMRGRSAILTGLVFLSMAFAMAQSFDNTTWKIKLTPSDEESRKAGAKEVEDNLTFKAGKFTSETFAKQGFAASAFEEDVRGIGAASFTASPKSDTNGSAKWTGTAAALSLKGELVITKKDGTVLHYTFTGERTGK